MDKNQVKQFVEQAWDTHILETLKEYIRIPNKSPLFDAQWQQHGYMDRAVELLTSWCREQNVKGFELTVNQLPGRTPLICIEVAGGSNETVLLYGHLDKQPEMVGWDEGKGPWQPVLENNRLYGRGGGDDGYAIFAALTAIKALQEQNIPHARCIIIIEACEESGSYDLPYYVDHLREKIGEPSLIVCLDSGCANYEQLWCSTSLRGMVAGELEVNILTNGVHSGSASGIVPSSFRILRQLLDRLEDPDTGEILVDALKIDIPSNRIEEAKSVAQVLGDSVWKEFPFVKGAQPVVDTGYELVLNRTWRPTLCVTGIGDIPPLAEAGNVLRPKTTVTLSFRLPPLCDAEKASAKVKEILEADPPYGAKVVFRPLKAAGGWNAPAVEKWLAKALEDSSNTYFGKPALYWGEGGSIPFMGMLGEKFPQAQFVVTGVLGPQSNAHGPNEFLDIPTAKKVTCCVAQVLAEHFNKS